MFWIAYRDEVREEYPILKQLTEEQEHYLLKHKVRIIPYKLKVAIGKKPKKILIFLLWLSTTSTIDRMYYIIWLQNT